MLPQDLHLAIEDRLGVTVESVSSVSGGCISQTGKISTSGGTFFAKWGEASIADTYAPEKEGLIHLRDSCKIIRIPDVIELIFIKSGAGLLLLEWIDFGSQSLSSWEETGRGLAELHQANTEALEYGFAADNYIGGTAQKNDFTLDWAKFFSECRLEPQWNAAERAGLTAPDWNSQFSLILDRLPDILPSTPRISLVHGDLWSGNVLADSTGRPVLIDPAVYYGNAEVDLAMSTLFGRFPDAFYNAYNEVIQDRDREASLHQIYNLYHLLNHLNLFGRAYQSAVGSTLKSIGETFSRRQ